MDIGSTVSNIGAVLLVTGLFAAIWGGRFFENESIRNIGILLAVAGFACLASGVVLF